VVGFLRLITGFITETQKKTNMKDVKQFLETVTGKIIVLVIILIIGLFIGSKFLNKKEPLAQSEVQDETPVVESASTEPDISVETTITQKKTTPQNKIVTTPESKPVIEQTPTPTPSKQSLRIDGLANIRISAGLMENWDADVENDGPVLDIVYLDNQGNIITSDATKKMPITADVKLYAGSDPLSKKDKVVFTQHFDYNQIILGGIYPKIRIPKEKISVDPNTDYQYGKSEVVIHTPEQGDFGGTGILVTLYE
jgi:hypothetical protein